MLVEILLEHSADAGENHIVEGDPELLASLLENVDVNIMDEGDLLLGTEFLSDRGSVESIVLIVHDAKKLDI